MYENNGLIWEYENNSRIRSRCQTPKQTIYNNYKNYQYLPQVDCKQKTQQKDHHNLYHHHQLIHNQSFQNKINHIIQLFNVLSRTLKSYVHDKKITDKNISKLLQTIISIIKAFIKTHLSQTSPKMCELINMILNTLLINKIKSKKSSKKIINIFKQKNEVHDQQKITRQKQQNIERQKKELTYNELQQTQLKKDILQLQYILKCLKNKGQTLNKIQKLFKLMNSNQKKQYIQQLLFIIEKQKQILNYLDYQY